MIRCESFSVRAESFWRVTSVGFWRELRNADFGNSVNGSPYTARVNLIGWCECKGSLNSNSPDQKAQTQLHGFMFTNYTLFTLKRSETENFTRSQDWLLVSRCSPSPNRRSLHTTSNNSVPAFSPRACQNNSTVVNSL